MFKEHNPVLVRFQTHQAKIEENIEKPRYKTTTFSPSDHPRPWGILLTGGFHFVGSQCAVQRTCFSVICWWVSVCSWGVTANYSGSKI